MEKERGFKQEHEHFIVQTEFGMQCIVCGKAEKDIENESQEYQIQQYA